MAPLAQIQLLCSFLLLSVSRLTAVVTECQNQAGQHVQADPTQVELWNDRGTWLSTGGPQRDTDFFIEILVKR